jgi:hypothetical protein
MKSDTSHTFKTWTGILDRFEKCVDKGKYTNENMQNLCKTYRNRN